MPVIFTYLRADCPCDVKAFLDLASFRLLWVGSGRDTGQKSISDWHNFEYPGSHCSRVYICTVKPTRYSSIFSFSGWRTWRRHLLTSRWSCIASYTHSPMTSPILRSFTATESPTSRIYAICSCSWEASVTDVTCCAGRRSIVSSVPSCQGQKDIWKTCKQWWIRNKWNESVKVRTNSVSIFYYLIKTSKNNII